jgi:hypothetical protein
MLLSLCYINIYYIYILYICLNMPKFILKNHTITFTLFTDTILSPCYSISFKILNHKTNQIYKTRLYSSDLYMSNMYFATDFYNILHECFKHINNHGHKIILSNNDKRMTIQLYTVKFFCIKCNLHSINLKLKY